MLGYHPRGIFTDLQHANSEDLYFEHLCNHMLGSSYLDKNMFRAHLSAVIYGFFVGSITLWRDTRIWVPFSFLEEPFSKMATTSNTNVFFFVMYCSLSFLLSLWGHQELNNILASFTVYQNNLICDDILLICSLSIFTVFGFVFSRDNLCKNCKRPGHYARECPNVAICHNCALPGSVNLFFSSF